MKYILKFKWATLDGTAVFVPPVRVSLFCIPPHVLLTGLQQPWHSPTFLPVNRPGQDSASWFFLELGEWGATALSDHCSPVENSPFCNWTTILVSKMTNSLILKPDCGPLANNLPSCFIVPFVKPQLFICSYLINRMTGEHCFQQHSTGVCQCVSRCTTIQHSASAG